MIEDFKSVPNIIGQINDEQFGKIDCPIISLSGMINYITTPFDADAQAIACENKGKMDPNYKYAGMTAAEIKAQWTAKADESKHYGSLLDSYTEVIFGGNPDEIEMWKMDNGYDYDERLQSNCKGFDEFYETMTKSGFQYVGRELTLYGKTDKGNIIMGRLDCLFYNPNSKVYFIVDWKTTDEIKVEAFGNKKMKGPGYQLGDCDMNKYTTQLHVYKRNLIETYHLTDENHIVVGVCNLRKQQEENGLSYLFYKENFQYDKKLIDDFVDFSINKKEMLKKMK